MVIARPGWLLRAAAKWLGAGTGNGQAQHARTRAQASLRRRAKKCAHHIPVPSAQLSPRTSPPSQLRSHSALSRARPCSRVRCKAATRRPSCAVALRVPHLPGTELRRALHLALISNAACQSAPAVRQHRPCCSTAPRSRHVRLNGSRQAVAHVAPVFDHQLPTRGLAWRRAAVDGLE